LAELLVKVNRLHLRRHIFIHAVDVGVPHDHESLAGVDDLYRDEQADRDHIREQQDPSAEYLEEE